MDNCLKLIKNDGLDCFITSTVLSELELLKTWDRIGIREYKKAMSRWKRAGGRIIDFRNQLLSSAFRDRCVVSMGEQHGVKRQDIINDCNILTVSLKNGIDVFLSEDFHFTSKLTQDVVDEVTNVACSEYNLMCGEEMVIIDSRTFLESYSDGVVDKDIVESKKQIIKKSGKRL